MKGQTDIDSFDNGIRADPLLFFFGELIEQYCLEDNCPEPKKCLRLWNQATELSCRQAFKPTKLRILAITFLRLCPNVNGHHHLITYAAPTRKPQHQRPDKHVRLATNAG